MKLYFSPTSPYVRKVMVCAIWRGLDGRIEKIPTNPHESPADLLADNPLSKVPCLVVDDGTGLFGSQLICDVAARRRCSMSVRASASPETSPRLSAKNRTGQVWQGQARGRMPHWPEVSIYACVLTPS